MLVEMKKTLLLVFIHGFQGTDQTFNNFPKDLRALIAHTFPKINVLSITYPQFETRGELRECVARFKEWLQNKVIDLEVANGTPSPTVDPSVHVILCGHSMGGIVAAETLLSIARDEIIPPSYANDTTNATSEPNNQTQQTAHLGVPGEEERSTSAPPAQPTRLFFPYVQAILAFDTPYLGISPGVLAHGAEEHFQEASSAYKAYGTASKFFGWNTSGGAPAQIPEAANRGLPAAGAGSGGWGNWGKYAMYGGAAAAVAGVAGAAYMNWNQINQGFTWASSHLEFVGCLARGAELQQRVEKVVELTRTHGVGFANFYGTLHEKVTSKSKYAGAVLGQDRTFCVIPKSSRQIEARPRSDRDASRDRRPSPSPQKRDESGAAMEAQMDHGREVQDFALDPSKSKGIWVKCVNQSVSDEITSHVSMFSPDKNPDYHSMVPRARDQIAEWIDKAWYESSTDGTAEAATQQHA